jgi:hypothetical protein
MTHVQQIETSVKEEEKEKNGAQLRERRTSEKSYWSA